MSTAILKLRKFFEENYELILILISSLFIYHLFSVIYTTLFYAPKFIIAFNDFMKWAGIIGIYIVLLYFAILLFIDSPERGLLGEKSEHINSINDPNGNTNLNIFGKKIFLPEVLLRLLGYLNRGWLFYAFLLAIGFNLFHSSDSIFVRFFRHLSSMLFILLVFFEVWEKKETEYVLGFIVFVFFCFGLYLGFNLLVDANAFHFWVHFEKKDQFLWIQKRELLFTLSGIFIFSEWIKGLVKNPIKIGNLVFSVIITLIYCLIYYFYFWHKLLQGDGETPLFSLPLLFYLSQFGMYLIFILYHFNTKKYLPLIAGLVVLLSMSLQYDKPENYTMVYFFCVMMLFDKKKVEVKTEKDNEEDNREHKIEFNKEHSL